MLVASHMSNFAAVTKKRASSRGWRNRWAGRHFRPLSFQGDKDQEKAIRAGFDGGAWGAFRQWWCLEIVQCEWRSQFADWRRRQTWDSWDLTADSSAQIRYREESGSVFSENNRRINFQLHKLLKIHFTWTLSDSKKHQLCFHSRSWVISKWKGESSGLGLGDAGISCQFLFTRIIQRWPIFQSWAPIPVARQKAWYMWHSHWQARWDLVLRDSEKEEATLLSSELTRPLSRMTDPSTSMEI